MEVGEISGEKERKLFELSEFMKLNGISITRDSNGCVAIGIDLYTRDIGDINSYYHRNHRGYEDILRSLLVE